MHAESGSGYRLAASAGILLSLIFAACNAVETPLPASTKGLVAMLRGHEKAITDLAFSPDGAILASSSMDTTVRLWEVVAGRELATLHGHPNQVNTVAFSPDGRLLASGNGTSLGSTGSIRIREGGTPYMLLNQTPMPLPNMVILWDVATGAQLRRWDGFQTAMFTVAFSLDGRMLAAGSGTPTGPIDDAVRMWNVATGELEATLRERSTVWSIAFSPDGRTLASGNGEGITLWDVETGKARASLSKGANLSLAFSPDGKLLASSYSYFGVRLWDMTTNQELAKLEGHEGIVYALAFKPDGTLLASAGKDGTVRLWDVATTRLVATISIPETRVGSVAFSPEGTLLASGSSDGLIRLWDVAQVLED